MHRPRTARIFVGARRTVVLLASAGTMCLPIFAVQADATGAGPNPPSPFWVEPLGRAARQARVWRERGREGDADALRRISDRPTAVWLTGDDPHDQAEEVTRQAARNGRVPLLVAYNIPHRDCGLYSSGGASDADAYRDWVARAAEGIGPRRAWVVLEPDAIAHLASGCVAPAEVARERPELLAEAVRTFKSLPRTSVYLDAGNAGWISDQRQLAGLLKRSGVEEADGFALNVSNFHTTPVTREYGGRLSALLGGAHYIIDTSRNGNGPLPPSPGDRETWCNPPGRALGAPPTTVTGDPLVDALVWVKRPGESDGACRGAPPAGHWWAEYALGLATTTPSPVAERLPAQPPAPSAAPAAPAPTIPTPAAPPAPAPVPAQQPAPARAPGA
ncbi:glycoside hydrolase family 6 protein [Streptomyces luteireticuli]|uniref:Glucanase n=1 Tax=Streptomyces luteireticuli TaxID=173858 RepID=A0ABP3IF88_9ACTN